MLGPLAQVALQRCHQSDVVQDARSQLHREVMNRVQRLLSHHAELTRDASRLILTVDAGSQPVQAQLNGGECLAGLVVQLLGEATALLLLPGDNALEKFGALSLACAQTFEEARVDQSHPKLTTYRRQGGPVDPVEIIGLM